MTDIFREVEEDVRRERFEKLWKAYGNYMIAALVLLFAGIGGWQLWDRHEQQERAKVAASFIAAQRITNPQAGQQGSAIALYKQIAADDSGTIGMVARLRAAWALADSDNRADLADLLKPLDVPGSAWRENAQEVLAYADYRAMDTKSALAKYASLAVDPQAPDALRNRAQAMAAFLKNGGAMSYGTVPADAIPTPPQVAGVAPAAPAAAAPAKK